jgi:hypothetical protein
MNTRRLRGELTPPDCKRCHHAWTEAARLDRPLNRMLTVRPGGDLSPLDHAELVDRIWNKLGGWSRYHGDGFYCVLVREKEIGRLEHFHVLIHVPPRKARLFKETVPRWFADADVLIEPATQRVKRMRNGKLGSVIGYLTKQRTPQAAWRSPYLRRRGTAPVLGKRARISRTLGGERSAPPQGAVASEPPSTPGVSPSIQPEAA